MFINVQRGKFHPRIALHLFTCKGGYELTRLVKWSRLYDPRYYFKTRDSLRFYIALLFRYSKQVTDRI